MKSASTPILLRLASNTTWLVIERCISLAVAVGVGFYFVRYLGRDDFGAYSYSLGLYVLFSTASKLGINALVVNDTVQLRPNQSVILGSAFTLRIIASLICILILNIVTYLLGDGAFSRELTLVCSIALLFGPFETVTHWFEATVQLRPVSLARSISSILIGLTRFSFILTGVGLLWFVWLVPLEGFLTTVFFIVAYRSRGFRIRDWKADSAVMKRFVREGIPLFFSALAVVVYMRIDTVMLQKMTTPGDVGIYSAAVRISEMFYFIPVMLSGVLFPYLIKANASGSQFFQRAFQVMCDGVAWIAILIAIPITLFAVPLTTLAYGTEFLPSAQILVVHVWAGVFVFLETMRLRWLVIHKLTLFQFWTTALGAVSNVLLNLYLIPRYQGFGAAIATVVSYGVAVVFSCFFYTRTREIGFMLIKSLFAPLRIRRTWSDYVYVRAAVDRRLQSRKSGAEWSDPEMTQDVFR